MKTLLAPGTNAFRARIQRPFEKLSMETARVYGYNASFIMFATYCFLLLVLCFLCCDMYASICEDCVTLFGSQRINVGVQEIIPSYNIADSRTPEIFEEQPSSIDAPRFALAIPGMALLAGLALAAFCCYQIKGTRVDDLEEIVSLEDSMETEGNDDSEDDAEFDNDDDLDTEIDDNEDSLELEDEEDIDLDNDADLHPEMDDEARLEDSLELKEIYDTEDDLSTETDEEMRPDEDLDNCEVAVTQMEHLWKDAQQEIELFRKQLLERDLLLEKKEDEGKEMKSHFEKEINERDEKVFNLLQQDEQFRGEKYLLEQDLRLALDQLETTERTKKEQTSKINSLENHLQEKDLLLKRRNVEESEMRRLFQQEMAKKERDLEATLQKETELSLKLKESENTNELLDLENEEFCMMTEELRNILAEKEKEVHLLKESLAFKTKELEEGQEQREIIERRVKEVEDDNSTLREKLRIAEAENVNIQQILGDELQAIKNWVAELGRENVKNKEELEGKELKIMLLEESLKQKETILQDAFHHWKDIEKLLEGAMEKETEMEASLTTLEAELQKRNLQIEDFLTREEKSRCQQQEFEDKLDLALHYAIELQTLLKKAEERERKIKDDLEEQMNKNHLLVKEKEDEETEIRRQHQETLRQKDKETEKQRECLEELQDNLESALRQEQSLERLLESKEEDLICLKKKESEAQLEVQQLLKDCDMLKEKIQLQEQNRMREEKCLREQLRAQEEALREHDKYMLMMFLHGTAQRNFQLEHIALEHGDDMIEEGKREKCTRGTIGKKDTGNEEDPCEKARETEEKQCKEYWNAQREKNEDYEKQWEGLKHIVEDVLHGDE
ncbi:trichohyalin-like [Macrobrachium nipponense]|uniref:trichohyalin-like n=1 Tax=Macrobrachium nipponense TaxID=159736 RepID=UPI0030C7FAB4